MIQSYPPRDQLFLKKNPPFWSEIVWGQLYVSVHPAVTNPIARRLVISSWVRHEKQKQKRARGNLLDSCICIQDRNWHTSLCVRDYTALCRCYSCTHLCRDCILGQWRRWCICIDTTLADLGTTMSTKCSIHRKTLTLLYPRIRWCSSRRENRSSLTWLVFSYL